jgi:hypothetical protein
MNTRAAAMAKAEPYETTEMLIARFLMHCDRIERAAFGPGRAYHVACARGLHKLLADRACQGDAAAEYAALGAPHFITFSDEQARTI